MSSPTPSSRPDEWEQRLLPLVTIVPYIGWLGVIVGLQPTVAGALTTIVPIVGVIWMRMFKPAENV